MAKQRQKKEQEGETSRETRQTVSSEKKRKTAVCERSPVWLPEAPSLFLTCSWFFLPPPFPSSFSHKLRCFLIHTHRLKHPNPPQQLSPKPGSAKDRGSHSYSGHTLRGRSSNQCLAAPSSLMRTPIMHYHLLDNTHTRTHIHTQNQVCC